MAAPNTMKYSDVDSTGEAMAEILAHEYAHSARALGGAWPITRMLDRIKPLTLAGLADWNALSRGRRDLRAAAPGITFLLTCQELHGRERTLKLFEELRKGTLDAAAAAAFKTRSAGLEEAWLKKVRGPIPEENVTITSNEDAPAPRPVPGPPPSASRCWAS